MVSGRNASTNALLDFDADLGKIKGNILTLIVSSYHGFDKILDIHHPYLENMPISFVLDAISESNCYSEIRHLFLQKNKLSGHVQWRLLPPRLKTLRLEGNNLKGKIAWNALPSNLNMLTLSQDMAARGTPEQPLFWRSWTKSQKYISIMFFSGGDGVLFSRLTV